jgi:hypothetical protein
VIDYGRHQLIAATGALACGSGTVQQRLENAYVSHLSRIDERADLPGMLLDEFNAVTQRLTANGSIEDTVARMGDEEAKNLAEKIVDLAFRLEAIRADAIGRERGED